MKFKKFNVYTRNITNVIISMFCTISKDLRVWPMKTFSQRSVRIRICNPHDRVYEKSIFSRLFAGEALYTGRVGHLILICNNKNKRSLRAQPYSPHGHKISCYETRTGRPENVNVYSKGPCK